ncbi:MAG TPA: hypothetical protein ENI27_05490, partial [bacterium]|nr:hypothetical protein [bacterium]
MDSTMKLEDLKDINAPVSSTMLICVAKCLRKAFFRYRWGIVPKYDQFSIGKIVGKLFHRLLQLGPEGVERVRQEVVETQKKLMEQIQKGEDLTGDLARSAQNLTDIFHKSLAMVKIFWERYPQPSHLETIGKEIRIELVLETEDVLSDSTAFTFGSHILKGFLDSLVRNKENGDIWIRDAKTTGRALKLMMLGYAWSIPCRFYRYITHNWLKKNGHDPSKLRGIILDIARTPTIKFCKKDKDFDAYVERVKVWYDEQGDDAMLSKGIVYTEPLLPDELNGVLSKTVGLLNVPELNPEA